MSSLPSVEPLSPIPTRIDRSVVHRSRSEHVFISPIEVVAGAADLYEADVVADQRHAFFYEHPLDHVPGLLLVEAVRQMGTAVTHLYYGAATDSAFVLNDMDIKFTQFAEHDARLQIRMRIHDVQWRRDRVASLRCASTWWQSGKSIGTMDAMWSVYEARTMSRLRGARRPSSGPDASDATLARDPSDRGEQDAAT
jgi:hypothetical protein